MNEEKTSKESIESVQKLGEMIRGIEFAMVTTEDAEGNLRSRPMATQKGEFDGRLWFLTREHTTKVDEVRKHQPVNVSYSNPKDQKYVSVSGDARIVHDPEKVKSLWSPALRAWFPKGPEDPEVALLCVDVKKAEYWDSPSSKMVQLIGFVKAMTTGQPLKPGEAGENRKLDIAG